MKVKWRPKKLHRYPGNVRVMEFESMPPGILKFQTRGMGARTEEYLVGSQHFENLPDALKSLH